ncbi:hypothetical protein GCM10028806_35030 [Spirosoma terrae]|uniref:FHA domain-containing protein n=1 Tax=Spirosoma terrae TaxID=1968276 RepID=A0A6L9LAK3_9BACT|nr:FHA domain-containing protein [Spirosoma terrae]NDU97546.1 FHA domain-containing protein [Spirosoma terrae]
MGHVKLGECALCQSALGLEDNHPKVRPGNILKIKCPRCNTVNSIKVPAERISKSTQEQNHQAFTTIEQEVAWIIVHDEHTAAQTFPLKLGKNILGRFSPDKPCDVMIKTNDVFMSRNHSLIEVMRRPDNVLIFTISDISSTNGTFINAVRKLSKFDKLILKDGDTIQLGKTKVVLKTRQSTQNSTDATENVKREAYTKTVII